MFSTDEIQQRVQNRYIERVGSRLRKMRKLMTDRDWAALKNEIHQLAEGAHNFGYQDLADDVNKALEALNKEHLSRMAIDAEAKDTLERLFKKLDRFLVEEHRF